MRIRSTLLGGALAAALLASSGPARAQVVAAEPTAPIEAPFPAGAPAVETQVVLQIVVDAEGHAESVVATSRAPADTPDAFANAAVEAAKAATFTASTRDGRPIRARIEYVVVFRPPPGVASPVATAPRAPPAPPPPEPAPPPPPSPPVTTSEQDEDYAQVVQVRGQGWSSPRGVDDVRIKRDLLEASPRQQTSEMLSAAPGFFVDHEDGEGLGNDVYLRGFDLDHGSGIEMRVGNVPINSPLHVQGQGYADANFIIPEVVRSIRVLEGPFDPRQGDAAIVGSAYFDLGVTERATQVKASYGSFNQVRLVGIAAPEGADEETFAAFAVRKTDGFGVDRASESATVNAQYGFDIGVRDHVRLLATAYGSRATLPGVVRLSDVDAGLVGLEDTYPNYAQGQGVQTSRVILGADFDHVAPSGARFEFAPWVMWTGFRNRQNLTGDLYSSLLDPNVAGGQGDLWETTNDETALGVTSRFHGTPVTAGSWLEVSWEPGIYVRAGHTDQTKSLLNPTSLAVWDRRLDAGLTTLDGAGYFDVDLRFWKKLRLSGGVRADLLSVSIDDRLAYDVPSDGSNTHPTSAVPGALRATQGVPVSPRATLEVDVIPELAPVASFGWGFRSLDATANVANAGGVGGSGPSVQEGAQPYSAVRSGEVGLRAQTPKQEYMASVSLFETWVENELVFEATSGGFTTEGASIRRGVVGSIVAKPTSWLLASIAGSVTSGTFHTLAYGTDHYIPGVPPVLLRADVTARGKLLDLAGGPVVGRVGVGYTYLAGRYLTEQTATVRSPSNNVLNGSAGVRYRNVEVGVDGYNLLGLHYADDEEYYISNWNPSPNAGPTRPTTSVHVVSVAPPLTVLGTVSLYF
jgi:hypothetical protein